VIPRTDTGYQVQVVCHQQLAERAIFSRRPSGLQFRGALESKGSPQKGVLKTVCLRRMPGLLPGFLLTNDDWPTRVGGAGSWRCISFKNNVVPPLPGLAGCGSLPWEVRFRTTGPSHALSYNRLRFIGLGEVCMLQMNMGRHLCGCRKVPIGGFLGVTRAGAFFPLVYRVTQCSFI
jgi:hypothetical protein